MTRPVGWVGAVGVLNKHHHGGRVPHGAVDIMLGTRWGNPFVIGRDVDRADVVRRVDPACPGFSRLPMSHIQPVALPWVVAAGVLSVHVLIACLYAVTLWLSLLAYLLITGGTIALLLLDAALWGVRWLWRNRGTWRWWRSAC
jgi:hypothetical protein